MSDRAAIEALVSEFVWRIDHGEADRVPELFTSDGRFAVPGSVVQGQEQLAAVFAARARQAHVSRHVCTNLWIEFEDEGHASGRQVATVYRHVGPGRGVPDPVLICDYEDQYEKGDDGFWRISERCVIPVFERADTEPPPRVRDREPSSRRRH